MLRSEMQKVVRKINALEVEIDRLERRSDRAFDMGDRKKADELERTQYEKAIFRNGMIEACRILGFRIDQEWHDEKRDQPGPGFEWVVNEHDELKLF